MKSIHHEQFIWTVAVLIALLWHALIWTRFPPAEPAVAAAQARRQPRLAYFPHQTENMTAATESEARALMTPVLFSLPSTLGFSQPAMQLNEDVLQYKTPREEEVALLENPLVEREQALLSWPRHMDGQVAALLNNPLLSNPRMVLEKQASATGKPTIHLVLAGSMADLEFAYREFELDLEKQPARPWQAKARIAFDDSGLPTQVFLVEPSENADINSAIIRQLYRWRLAAPPGPVSGHVLLTGD